MRNTSKSSSKTNQWLGIIFILMGFVFLAPLFYRSFSSIEHSNAVGSFFGIGLGLTFLIVGMLQISKSKKPQENSPDCITEQAPMWESHYPKPNKRKTPMFIKLVALSPAIPLCIVLITQAGCDFFSLTTCKEHYSAMEAMSYWGGLGWIVSLPIAGMLKLIHWAARSD